MQHNELPFNLPMMLTFLESKNGNHAIHSLDFDIAAVAENEDEAWDKMRLAIKTYVAFGLANGWKEYIMLPAPKKFWDKITPEVRTQIMPPIILGDVEKKVVVVHERTEDGDLEAAG